jgi:hypothetical protein
MRMCLKDDYTLANCCKPENSDAIIGYYSHDNFIKVHKKDCPNLAKAEAGRLLALEWDEIIAFDGFHPDEDYQILDDLDFRLLDHHLKFGFDYSLKVAAMLHQDAQIIFDKHVRLKKMKLIQRVAPKMIQYRKNIVKGKWIKHRNHTYYDLTDKGRNYLQYYQNRNSKDD